MEDEVDPSIASLEFTTIARQAAFLLIVLVAGQRARSLTSMTPLAIPYGATDHPCLALDGILFSPGVVNVHRTVHVDSSPLILIYAAQTDAT